MIAYLDPLEFLLVGFMLLVAACLVASCLPEPWPARFIAFGTFLTQVGKAMFFLGVAILLGLFTWMFLSVSLALQ